LTSLNISSNSLSRGKLKVEPAYVKNDQLPWGSKDGHYDSDVSGIVAIANAIPGMRALTSLDVSNNNLGQLVPPEGWTKGGLIAYPATHHWSHTDGRKEEGVMPSGSKPAGIIALVNAIPDMRAMTSLNLASNELGVEGAKIIAACLPKCT
jgi:hypothetical protein